MNKRLSLLNLPNIFSDLEIKGRVNGDKKFNAILTSPFQPGKYVKKVLLKDFRAPNTFAGVYKTKYPLHQLIKHCPNVISLDLQYGLRTVKEWEYFLTVISRSDNTWTLQVIPKVQKMSKQPKIYFKCADCMRRRLRELYLARGTITRKYYELLGEFENLIKLLVYEKKLEDLYDCHSVLKYLPKPEYLKVCGFTLGNNVNSKNIAAYN
jgi:hypothetical protein